MKFLPDFGDGDIMGIVAGTGLSGSSLSGPIPTLNVDASIPEITTLAGLTSFGSAGATTNILAGDIDWYNPVTNGDPKFRMGVDVNECLEITANYQSGTQSMQLAQFTTSTASGTANDGRFQFWPDEVKVLSIDDGGIDFEANMGISINGTDILTDSSGTATLSNIDALDATTIATFETAMEANLDTLSSVTTVGTIGTGVWNGTAIGGNYIAATQPNIDSIGTDGDTLSILGDKIVMQNASSNFPQLVLTNLTDDATGPTFYLYNKRTDSGTQAGEDDDILGNISFYGYDDQPVSQNYAKIYSDIHDATSGEESGRLNLQVANHDGGLGSGLILTGGSENNEIDVTLGLGAGSVVTIPGDIDLAGDVDIDGTLETDALTVGGTNVLTGSLITTVGKLTGPVEIEQGASGGGHALLIDNDDVDQVALQIDGANTTTAALAVAVPDLTTGNAIYINADSLTTGSAIKLDVDDGTLTASATRSLLNIDYDKAGVTDNGHTLTTTGLDINLADAATNHAGGTVKMYGAQIDVDSANNQGSIHQTGLNMKVAADGFADTGNTVGLDMTVVDGGYDMIMRSHANTSDMCFIKTTTNGATSITTSDAIGSAAHFEIAADGDITLDAVGDIALECGGGDLTCDADTVTFESANADDPQVIIKNTTNDDQAVRLDFVKDRGAAAASGDNIAEIYFNGEDADQNPQVYGRIICQTDVTTGGEESGDFLIGVANHDGGNGYAFRLTGGSEDNEVDATLGLGANSVVTIPGNIDLAGDIDVDGTLETDALTVGGTAFTPSTTKQVTHHMIKDNIGTSAPVYISLGEIDAESGTISNKNLPLLAPVAGKLLKIFVRSTLDMSGADLTFSLLTRAASATTSGNAVVIGAQTGDGPDGSGMAIYDFTAVDTNAIVAGDKVQISVISDTAVGDSNYFITCLWEWDLS